MDNNKGRVDNIDLILKQTWLAVSKMYSERAQEYDSTAVQALTLLKIDPKEGTRSTNLDQRWLSSQHHLQESLNFLKTTVISIKKNNYR